MWYSYNFGVEIELIAEPHQVQHPFLRAVYYEKLAAALRSQGTQAVADRLNEAYSKHPEHYDKWWITKDGSLGNPDHPFSQYLEFSVLQCLPWVHMCESRR